MVSRTRLLSLVSLAVLSATASATYRQSYPLPSVTGADAFGLNVDPDLTELDIQRLRSTGVKWVRTTINWNGIEREKGTFTWDFIDGFFNRLQANRIRAVVILCYNHPEYGAERDKDGITTEEQKRGFQNYVRQMVTRYKGRGIIWEVWNEPNYPFFWTRPDANAYMDLLDATTATIRSIAPEEWVAGPSLAGIDYDFLDRCLKRDLIKKVDAVSFHPYRNAAPESFVEDTIALRRKLSQYPGGANAHLLNTEWGYDVGGLATDEATQRDYAVRLFALSLACDIPFTSYFSYRDIPPTSFATGDFGLVDENRRSRSSFGAMRLVGLQLKGFRYSGRLNTGDDRDWVVLFTNGRQEKIVAWTTRPAPIDLTLPLGPNTYVLQAMPPTASAPPPTQRIVRTGSGFSMRLTTSPQLVALLRTDPLLRRISTLPTLAAVKQVENRAEYVGLIQTYGTYMRQQATGATLTISDVPTDPTQTDSFTTTVSGTGNPAASMSLAEAQGIANGLFVGRDRSEAPRRLTFAITLPNRSPIRLESLVYPRSFLRLTTLSVADAAKTTLRVENPVGGAFAGLVRVATTSGATYDVPLTLASGVTEATVVIPVSRTEYQRGVSLVVRSEGANALPPTSRKLARHIDFAGETNATYFSRYQLITWRGQPAGTQGSIALETGGATLPGSTTVLNATALTYNYPSSQGGLFFLVNPPTSPRYTGAIQEATLWIDGDGSGNRVAMNFMDASGRFYQTKSYPVTWTGWRQVVIPLSKPEHWSVLPAPLTTLAAGFSVHTPFALVMDGATVRSGRMRFTAVGIVTR